MSEVPLVQMYSDALFYANLRVGFHAFVRGWGSPRVREVLREEHINLRGIQRDEPDYRMGKPGLRAARFSLYQKKAEEARASSDMALYRV